MVNTNLDAVDKEKWMRLALAEAKKAEVLHEVPIGAVVVLEGEVIGKGYNLRETTQDATTHAEMLAIKEACEKVGSWRLEDATLFVTLEPCPMCSGAILQSRIEHVVYGAKDPKGGCMESCMNMYEVKGFNHYPDVIGGVLEDECGSLLKTFFKRKREEKSK